MDLAALGLAAQGAPRRRAVWGAFAFVIAATVVDTLVARALDRRTGKAFPKRIGSPGMDLSNRDHVPYRDRSADHPTTIEPEDMPFIRAPDVTHH